MTGRLPAQRGYLLPTCLVLLLVLSLIATASLQLSALELRIADAFIRRLEALDRSEHPRHLLGEVLERHLLDRDWSAPLPAGFERIGGAAPWYGANSECGGAHDCPLPAAQALHLKARHDDGSAAATELYVFRLRTDPVAGQGLAMASGYLGAGRAAAAGGGRLYFHVESRAVARQGEPPPRIATAATYRHVIRN